LRKQAAASLPDEAQQPVFDDDEDLVELNEHLRHFDSPPTGCASGTGAALGGAAGGVAAAGFFACALARSAARAASTAAASVG